jgi:hypothetical protein
MALVPMTAPLYAHSMPPHISVANSCIRVLYISTISLRAQLRMLHQFQEVGYLRLVITVAHSLVMQATCTLVLGMSSELVVFQYDDSA